jgi:chemotaxis protein CheX
MNLPTLPTKNFPTALIDVMTDAVPASFGFLGGIEKEAGVPSCLSGPCDGMFAVMGFLGDHTWSFTLILPRETATGFTQSFTGFEIPYLSADMGDVVGELANVLAGEVISQLHNRNFVGRMGLPTVARGTDVELLLADGVPWTHMGYRCPFGSFGFKLMIAKPTKSWHRRIGLPSPG